MRNIWNVVSAIAGILAVAIAIYVFIQEREDKSKKLEVELVAQSTLINTELSEKGKKIEVLYNGQKIPNFSILQLRFFNSGGQPIRSTDYESPIILKFYNTSAVLSVERTASDPPDLPIKANISGNSIVVSKTLLNPGDWFIIEAGVVPIPEKLPQVKVTGRIAGVKKIEFKDSVAGPKEERQLSKYFMLTQAVLVLIMMVMQLAMRWMRRVVVANKIKKK